MVLSNGFHFYCCCCMISFLVLLNAATAVTRACAFTAAGRQDGEARWINAPSSMESMNPGSKPPSCLNKCDSCTPCQAVQTVQDASEVDTDIGSRPPSCQNKCNRCNPCQAVQVPTPDPKLRRHKLRTPPAAAAAASRGEISVEYSNYKPKGWRCQCGNKLFNP